MVNGVRSSMARLCPSFHKLLFQVIPEFAHAQTIFLSMTDCRCFTVQCVRFFMALLYFSFHLLNSHLGLNVDVFDVFDVFLNNHQC
ncbi:unnamed protein product [Caenorhabditis brenneri]